MLTKEEAEKLAREAFLDSRPIEAGWIVGILASLPDDGGDDDTLLMKYAYYSGARYVLSLMLTPPGKTMAEKKRAVDGMLAAIQVEMKKFLQEFNEIAKKEMSNNLH